MLYAFGAIAIVIVGFVVMFAMPYIGGSSEAPKLFVSGPRVGLRELQRSDIGELLVIDEGGRSEASERDVLEFGVVHLGSGGLVGVVTFRPVTGDHDDLPGLDFGIRLHEEARGQGIGSEATALAIGWMLDSGCRRVVACCAVENHPMRTILQKLAGDPYHEGSAIQPNGDEIDSMWFAIDDGGDDDSEAQGAEAELGDESG